MSKRKRNLIVLPTEPAYTAEQMTALKEELKQRPTAEFIIENNMPVVEPLQVEKSLLDEIIDTAASLQCVESEQPKIHYLRLLLAKLKAQTA